MGPKNVLDENQQKCQNSSQSCQDVMRIKNTNQNQPQEKTEPKSYQKGLGNNFFEKGVQNNPPPLKSQKG